MKREKLLNADRTLSHDGDTVGDVCDTSISDTSLLSLVSMDTLLTLSARPNANRRDGYASSFAGVPSLAKLSLKISFRGVASLEKGLRRSLLSLSLSGVPGLENASGSFTGVPPRENVGLSFTGVAPREKLLVTGAWNVPVWNVPSIENDGPSNKDRLLSWAAAMPG